MRFLTLRVRTFLFMLLNLLLAFLLTGAFSLFHFQEETTDYHLQRLERKERAIISHIEYVISGQDSVPRTYDEWSELFDERLNEIGSVHKLDLAIYHPKGERIAASVNTAENQGVLPERLNEFPKGGRRVPLGRKVDDSGDLLTSTSEILDADKEVDLIVKTLYRVDNSAIPESEIEYLKQLVFVYLFLLLLGIVLAFVLSNYISQNMRRVIEQLKKVRLNKTNEKLDWRFNDEIGELIQQYNDMVEQLERTAVELATSERESAWKEMAQQVAHEIKNPLTPMKLTLQMMQREKDLDELHSMTANLLEEIESLSHIAEAFSRFAQMPALSLDAEDVSYLTNRAASLYLDQGVRFVSTGPLTAKVDKEQWTRVIHNLIKNAVQSIPEDRERDILITAAKADNKAMISVQDNGGGIPEDMQQKVFEPNFTTKSSGMGLGLAMVKNLVISFGGAIGFDTSEKGTTFIIVLPLVNPKQK